MDNWPFSSDGFEFEALGVLGGVKAGIGSLSKMLNIVLIESWMLIASITLTNMLENYWWYDNLPVSAVVVVFEGLGEVWGGEGGSGMGGRDQVHLNKIFVRNWICASIVESDNMGQRFTSSIFTQSETFCKTNVKLEQATKERRKMLVDGNLQTLSFNIRSIKLLVVKNYKRLNKGRRWIIDLCLYSARDIFVFNPSTPTVLAVIPSKSSALSTVLHPSKMVFLFRIHIFYQATMEIGNTVKQSNVLILQLCCIVCSTKN